MLLLELIVKLNDGLIIGFQNLDNSAVETILIFFFTPFSSLMNEKFGRAFSNSSIIIFSALRSEFVTKSDGLFFETCNFFLYVR